MVKVLTAFPKAKDPHTEIKVLRIIMNVVVVADEDSLSSKPPWFPVQLNWPL